MTTLEYWRVKWYVWRKICDLATAQSSRHMPHFPHYNPQCTREQVEKYYAGLRLARNAQRQCTIANNAYWAERARMLGSRLSTKLCRVSACNPYPMTFDRGTK